MKSYSLGMKIKSRDFQIKEKEENFQEMGFKEVTSKFFRLKQDSTKRKLKSSGMKEEHQK